MPSRDRSAELTSHLPLRQLLRLRALGRDVERVEVHPAVALGQERDAPVVGQELRACCRRARLAHPRFVLQRVDDPRLPGLRLERDEPPVLVVGRARRGDHVAGRRPKPPASTSGSRDRRAGRGAASRRRLPAPAEPASRVSATGGAKLPSAHTLLPVFRLRIASSRRSCVSPTFVRAGNVFGVAALGDVVRHDRALRAGGPLGDEDEDVGPVGRQHQVGGASADPAARRRAAFGLRLLLGLLLALLLLADVADQLLFLFADELLAVGEPGIRSSSAATSVSCVTSAARCRLHRDDEQVAVADVGHVRVVARPARVRLGRRVRVTATPGRRRGRRR